MLHVCLTTSTIRVEFSSWLHPQGSRTPHPQVGFSAPKKTKKNVDKITRVSYTMPKFKQKKGDSGGIRRLGAKS